MKQYYIYKTTNKINGMMYVGSHYGRLNDSYLGSGLLITRAIKKHGKKNFKKEIIEIAIDKKILFEREGYWLKKYNCATDSMFYNLTNTSNCGLLTDGKTKEELKIIAAKRLVSMAPIQEEAIKKMVETRKNWSDDQKKAFSETCSKTSKKTWEKMTEEQKEIRMQKILNTKKNLPEWKKKLTSQKRSEQAKKWWSSLSEEQRKNRSMRTGRKNRGRINSYKAKKNISDGVKNYFLNMSEDDLKIRLQSYKKISDKISLLKWCNDGVKNYRKSLGDIKLQNLKEGKIKHHS